MTLESTVVLRRALDANTGVATLVDATLPHFDAHMFDLDYWRERDAVVGAAGGRGTTVFVSVGDTGDKQQWALRHYFRGGLIARLSADRYVFTGYGRSRAFREWQLLALLCERGLPVPRPVAARCVRRGPFYTADLITRRLDDARPLTMALAAGELTDSDWVRVGELLARFHAAGVWHADLNANNIMLQPAGRLSLLDFDRGRLRGGGRWREANLHRLHRSLRKEALRADVEFEPAAWSKLLAGYRAAQS